MAIRIFPGTAVNETGAKDMVDLRRDALRAGAIRHYTAGELEQLVDNITPAYYLKLPATFNVITYLDCQRSDDSEVLTGFAVVGTRTHRLTSLYVHPDHWRRGVGRMLLDAARPSTKLVESPLSALPFFRACGMGCAQDVLLEVGSLKLRFAALVWLASADETRSEGTGSSEHVGKRQRTQEDEQNDTC
mmetsp:Transcript_63263/g.206432  ORF Transcript_63263/g.206432 Transcript_63263/m.206432 type:complete len:189 (-) Transcript_63263:407-973(-)